MSSKLTRYFTSLATMSTMALGFAQPTLAQANDYIDYAIDTLKSLHPVLQETLQTTQINRQDALDKSYTNANVALQDGIAVINMRNDISAIQTKYDILISRNQHLNNNPDFDSFARMQTTLTLGHEIGHILQTKSEPEWMTNLLATTGACSDILALEISAHDFTYQLAAKLYEQVSPSERRAINWALSEGTNTVNLLQYNNHLLAGDTATANALKQNFLDIRTNTYKAHIQGACDTPPAIQAQQAAHAIIHTLKN